MSGLEASLRLAIVYFDIWMYSWLSASGADHQLELGRGLSLE